ncbi:MAG: tRNA (N(6)-L-threonylcarbamoyladenosine(37)-C(2))-methylthiotransferase MtaB [Bacteroidales bacterium]|jgi:threonylcarbamoyladenosine tRNA methylthiotransferase MtaB|nr:tRNA (N(6)-L-threonylcarbamoyladenosine(37)-C(2))-methylthiotransferase MtaB [Bacteroidales bacterium]
MKNFEIHTLGCKLNYSESAAIAAKLEANGWHQGGIPEIIVLNTCAVTQSAEKKTRNLASKLHRDNPLASIVVVGCYSALKPELLERWSGVIKVFGSSNKMSCVDFILQQEPQPVPNFFDAYSTHDRTRSFLKIQDGCNSHCTYCTVWIARGKSRSDTIENVLKNIQNIADSGLHEVNLTGVNVGDFGKGTKENLLKLLKAIVKQNAIERVRISSIEPELLSPEIIRLVAKSPILMPHFHLPLQAGCDRVLSAMRRRYTTQEYAEKVMLIKKLMPDACVACDVIAGFPGETDEEFEETYHFLEQLPISYMHVFPYSRRPRTHANLIEEQVSDDVKHERTERLLELSHAKKLAFYSQCEGQTRPVLVESEAVDDQLFGFTDNYIRVSLPNDPATINTIQKVTIEQCRIVL